MALAAPESSGDSVHEPVHAPRLRASGAAFHEPFHGAGRHRPVTLTKRSDQDMGAAAPQLCQTGGQITEIRGQLLDGLARTLRDRYGFTLRQHRFAITGCCAR